MDGVVINDSESQFIDQIMIQRPEFDPTMYNQRIKGHFINLLQNKLSSNQTHILFLACSDRGDISSESAVLRAVDVRVEVTFGTKTNAFTVIFLARCFKTRRRLYLNLKYFIIQNSIDFFYMCVKDKLKIFK